jgi:hypothetical protein
MQVLHQILKSKFACYLDCLSSPFLQVELWRRTWATFNHLAENTTTGTTTQSICTEHSILKEACPQAIYMTFVYCVTQLSVPVTNIWDNQLIKRKRLFWLIGLAFHSMTDWPCCFWACGAHQGGSKLLISWPGAKQREKEVRGSLISFKDNPQWSKDLPLGLSLKGSISSSSAILGIQSLTHESLGDI